MITYTLEVAKIATTDFKQVDDLFNLAIINVKNKNELDGIFTKLGLKLSKILKTKCSMYYVTSGSFKDNAAIIPVIKTFFSINDKSSLDLVHIKKLNIYIGIDLIKSLSSSELTSVLLHEIGHVANHISYISHRLKRVFFGSPNLISAISFYVIANFMSLTLLPLIFIYTRTATFFSHLGEYNADKFVIEHGYGDELISVMSKWNKHYNKKASESKLQKILEQLSKLVYSSHPDFKKRMIRLADSIKSDNKNEYDIANIDKLLEH